MYGFQSGGVRNEPFHISQPITEAYRRAATEGQDENSLQIVLC